MGKRWDKTVQHQLACSKKQHRPHLFTDLSVKFIIFALYAIWHANTVPCTVMKNQMKN